MLPTKEVIPKDSIYPFRGINTYDPSTLSDPRFSPDCLNVDSHNGIIARRLGYRKLGSRTEPREVLSIFNYEHGETVETIAVGVDHIFAYDSTNDWWIAKHPDGATTVTITGVDTGDDRLAVSSSDITSGDLVRVDGATPAGGLEDDAEYYAYSWDDGGVDYVSLHTNYADSLTGANPVDLVSGGSGGDLNVIDPVFTGTEDDWVDWEVATDTTAAYCFVTNGKDNPLVWDGTDNFEDWDDSSTPNGLAASWTTRCVVSHYGRLLVANTDQDSNDVTVHFSVLGDFGDWSGEGSGSIYFSKASGQIVRMVPIGDRIAVFSENAIDVMTYVGGDIIYATDHVVDDTRLLSGRSVVSIGPYLMFMGERNIYLFDGTRVLRPIGKAIENDYRENLDRDNLEKAFAFHDPAHETAYFTIPTPTGSKTYVLKYDLYDMSNLTWVPYEFTDRPLCMGFYALSADLGWDDVSEDWDEMGEDWDSYSVRTGFPVRVIGGSSAVYSNDMVTVDEGTAFTSYWESIDLTSPQYESLYMRWEELELELKKRGGSENIAIYYSTDQGVTWHTVGIVDLSSDWTLYRRNIDVKSRTVRFRVQGYFEMRWLRAWALPGEPR